MSQTDVVTLCEEMRDAMHNLIERLQPDLEAGKTLSQAVGMDGLAVLAESPKSDGYDLMIAAITAEISMAAAGIPVQGVAVLPEKKLIH